MPTPFDLLSEKLDDPDPMDDLDLLLGQDQGANLAGGPEKRPDAQPNLGGAMPQPIAPSPNVAGPLAALAKPHIRLKNKSEPPKVKKIKPKIRLKAKPPEPPPRMAGKPHIRPKSGAFYARI